jgi:hypothetical protein
MQGIAKLRMQISVAPHYGRRFLMLVLVLCLTAFVTNPMSGQSAEQNQKLIGLWGAELDFGPLVHGPITIDSRGMQWRALVDGFDVPLKRVGSSLIFTVPGGVGEFRGHLRSGDKAICGQWIQPASGVLFSQYATPVELIEIAPGVWHGQVSPLQPHISFYVSIRLDPNGGLSAFIRNPEFGWLQRRSYAVELAGKDVKFSGSQTNNQFSGTFDPQADQLTALFASHGEHCDILV